MVLWLLLLNIFIMTLIFLRKKIIFSSRGKGSESLRLNALSILNQFEKPLEKKWNAKEMNAEQ